MLVRILYHIPLFLSENTSIPIAFVLLIETKNGSTFNLYLRLKKLEAHESQRVLEPWEQASMERLKLFGHEAHFYLKMLKNHSQTIFLINKLGEDIKQVIRHHNRPYYSILYWVHQFWRHFRKGGKRGNNI